MHLKTFQSKKSTRSKKSQKDKDELQKTKIERINQIQEELKKSKSNCEESKKTFNPPQGEVPRYENSQVSFLPP